MEEKVYNFLQNDTEKQSLHLMLAGISYCDGSYRISRPNSPISVIEYVMQGTGTVHVGDETFYPTAGDCYFLQEGEDQLYYADGADPWVKIWVNVQGPLIRELLPVYGLNGRHLFRNFPIKDILQKIVRAAQNKDRNASMHCSLLLHEILLRMNRHLHPEGNVSDPEEVLLKNYIDSHFTERLTLADMVTYIGKSESQLIRIFRQGYGQTPYSYLLDKKLDFAKSLLTDTNMTVLQIAEHLHFADEYYFSNFFKSRVGVSPLRYKQQQTEKREF